MKTSIGTTLEPASAIDIVSEPTTANQMVTA